MTKPSTETLAILSRFDELRFLSRKSGVYEEVQRQMDEKTEDGEPVSGPWIMETVKAVQVQRGLV